MVHYRRNKIKGGIYFLTVALRDRQSSLLIDNIQLLGKSIKHVKSHHPFINHAIVVLPDHLHVLWELPEEDDNYSLRIRQIKTLFTRNLPGKTKYLIQEPRGEYYIWQRRFWEHTIRNDLDFERHFDYIHYNPVKHGLVNAVRKWPYSSFHRYATMGTLPLDWCGDNVDDNEFGE